MNADAELEMNEGVKLERSELAGLGTIKVAEDEEFKESVLAKVGSDSYEAVNTKGGSGEAGKEDVAVKDAVVELVVAR